MGVGIGIVFGVLPGVGSITANRCAARVRMFHNDAGRSRQCTHAFQSGVVGDAQPVGILHPRLERFQPSLDLRPGAVHQNQPDAEAVQQGDVVYQIGKACIGYRFAAECQHEGLAPVRVNIWR